jgi:hypothetical protein
VLHDCVMGAFGGRMTFRETVMRMIETGVERYDTDLTRMEKTQRPPERPEGYLLWKERRLPR